MESDLDTAAFIFRRKFTQPKTDMMTEREHPRWGRLTRKSGFTGTEVAYDILTGNPQGISGSFEVAQRNASSSKGKQPKVTRRPKFGVIKINAEAAAASEDDDGAFYRLTVREGTGIFIAMGRRFAFDAYRDGSGRLGRRASITGNVITLEDPTDVNNFDEGMVLIADNNDNGLTPKTGTATVTGLGTEGTITVDSAAGISGFADNDYLFVEGDPGTAMDGLALCTPLVAPTAGDDFRGMDRSSNVPRLAGSRVANDGTATEERLGLGALRCSMVGRRKVPTECYVHPLKFWEVSKRRQANVMYGNPGKEGYRASYGYQYIEIVTPAGTMTMYSDPDCPQNLGYGERPENHYVHHLKGLPHFAMQGGDKYIIVYNAAAIEARLYSWGNYVQEDPAQHFVADLSPG